MAQDYYVFLAEVVIASSGDDFDYTDPTSRTGDLGTSGGGSYFLRGDDTATDLAKLFKTAVNDNPGLAIDTASVTFDVDPANAPFTFTLDGDGSWDLLSTGTYDLTTLGFASLPITSTGAGVITTTKGSKFVWVPPEPPTADDPLFMGQVSQNRTVGGQVYTTELGGPYEDRRLSFAMLDPARVLKASNSGDENATFQAFWEYVRSGKRFEVHKTTISSGTTLGSLSSSTLVGTYVLGEQSAANWTPARHSPGLELYSFDVPLLEYTA